VISITKFQGFSTVTRKLSTAPSHMGAAAAQSQSLNAAHAINMNGAITIAIKKNPITDPITSIMI
jgi:hypothetical protein